MLNQRSQKARGNKSMLIMFAIALFVNISCASQDDVKYPIIRCPKNFAQEKYSSYPMKSNIQQIFHVDETYTWLRECLIERMPDGSLCCVFFTGGRFDNDIDNMIVSIRSDDDGRTWSDVEVIRKRKGAGAWAPSMITHNNRTYLFWYPKTDGWFGMSNRIFVTKPGGREFIEDRPILEDWPYKGNGPGEGIADIRHGTILRNGRVLLPTQWKDNGYDYVGVMEPNSDFTSFTHYGKIYKPTPEGPTKGIPLFENTIAELSDGKLAMLIRGDLNKNLRSGYLWRSDSQDEGKTWSEPYLTDIPNPGTKPRIINLPDGRIVLFHNPYKKDYSDPNVNKNHHRHRTQLEMWVSADDLKSWYLKRVIVSAPFVAQYPDAFYDAVKKVINLCWEDDKTIYFQKIMLEEF